MRTSDNGLRFLIAREGKRNAAYPDPATGGEPITIGVGHTEPGVIKLGMYWTDQQVMDALREDVQRFEDAINRLVQVALTQNQFDALVSFVFNVGEGNFANSTLLRLLNGGDYAGSAAQFIRWNKANGQVMGGLTIRRQLEAELFETP